METDVKPIKMSKKNGVHVNYVILSVMALTDPKEDPEHDRVSIFVTTIGRWNKAKRKCDLEFEIGIDAFGYAAKLLKFARKGHHFIAYGYLNGRKSQDTKRTEKINMLLDKISFMPSCNLEEHDEGEPQPETPEKHAERTHGEENYDDVAF